MKKTIIRIIIAIAVLAWLFAPRNNAAQQREQVTVAMLASGDAIGDPQPF